MNLFRARQSAVRRALTSALAVTPRGGVASDRLRIRQIAVRAHLQWLARPVHPWDRHLSAARQAEIYQELALRDTDAAILSLCRAEPEIEQIDLRVLDCNDPNAVILAGSVSSEDVLANQRVSSVAMRLRMLGIRYNKVSGSKLEPLAANLLPTFA